MIYKEKVRRKLLLLTLIMVVTCSFTAGHYFLGESGNLKSADEDRPADGCVADAGLFSDKKIKLPIIMYHSVIEGNTGTGDYVVSKQTLENDLKWLEENGYETVFVQDVIDYVKNDGELPKKPVMITFDDGDINNMNVALKVMEKYNAKGVYSVVGKYCESEEGYIDWDNLKIFAENPLTEIQNHSYNMHSLGTRRGSGKIKGESEAQYITNFANDTSKMQILLKEKADIEAVCYTYPFGIISQESISIVKAMGFEASLTCYEKENLIEKGNDDCLFLMNRYNRASGETTESYMKRLTGE